MSWPASFLSGPAAATGFAVINSCGSIGGFIGPFLIGALKRSPSGWPQSALCSHNRSHALPSSSDHKWNQQVCGHVLLSCSEGVVGLQVRLRTIQTTVTAVRCWCWAS